MPLLPTQPCYSAAADEVGRPSTGAGRTQAHINMERQDRKDLDLAELMHAAMQKGGLTDKAMLPSASKQKLNTVSLRHLTRSQRERVIEEALQVPRGVDCFEVRLTPVHQCTLCWCSACRQCWLAVHAPLAMFLHAA